MITEFVRALAFIFVAEMGDKTQILAMAFATKYSIKKVLLGIFIGSLLNHGIAVLLGSSLTRIMNPNTLQIIAGFAFIIFALWSLKMNKEEEGDKKKVRYGPVVTVAVAFFIGELGDKTQLTAITLSANSQFPLFILMGTVLGMVVTGALGIYVGIKLGKKIPEFFIKLGAAIIFFIFGFLKLFQSIPDDILKIYYVIPFIAIVLVIAYLLLLPTLRQRKQDTATLYRKTAEQLRSFYNNISNRLEDICLGENVCGSCGGTNCLIGYTKELIRSAKNGIDIDLEYIDNIDNQKNFDKVKVLESLKLTIDFLKDHPGNSTCKIIHQARMNFETILFKTHIEDFNDYKKYKSKLDRINKSKLKI